MKTPSCFLLAFFFPLLVFTQNGTPPVGGARAIGMGYTGTTFTDINSLFSNQAGLAKLERATAIAFAEQRFLLNELQGLNAGVALPTNSGTFGLSLNYFGFDDYNEQRAGLAYARQLVDKLSIGAQMLVLNTQIAEYGNQANVTFEIGLLAEVLPQLSLGVHLYSPARIEITTDEYLPSVFKLGLSYLPSDKLSILAEVEKDIDYALRTKVGLEYNVLDQLSMRMGLATQPVNISFGLGYQLKNGLALDVASSYHEILGFTPSAGIIMPFGKEK
jgi:hypothetical protein